MRSTSSTALVRTHCSRFLRSRRERALLLLVCHSASRVLPTLRSRCSVLAMRPLAQSDVARALAASVGSAENDPQIEAAAAAADGSVARALAFLDEDALALRQRALEELERLPYAQCQRAACAWRCACGHRPAAAWRFCRYRQRLAVAKPRRSWRRERRPRATRSPGRSVGADQCRRARRRNLQFGAKTACLQCVRIACRGHRAVDTYAPSLAGQKARSAVFAR